MSKNNLPGLLLIGLILMGGCARVVSGLGARLLSVDIELGGNRDPNAYYYLVFNINGQPPYVPNSLTGSFYTPEDPSFQFSAAAAYISTWTHYIILGPDGFYKIIRGPFLSGGSYPPDYLEAVSGEQNKIKIQLPLSRLGVDNLSSLNFNIITVQANHQIIDKLNLDYTLAPVEAGVSVIISPEPEDALDETGTNIPALDIVGGVMRIE